MFAIEIDSISKRFRVPGGSAAEPRYGSLRDEIASFFVRGGSRKLDMREFWALRNVSVAIKDGEAVGLIGRNGAGKSTLLKILSRVTPPTSGCIRIRGRVASLLEVGAGFHPELTGRENIYFNGAMLGMSRRDIGRRFAEIVAFAGVEDFVDLAVKRYSSGMYMRLAFAVAAHVESDVMLVDEVLAVGDAEFQKRCLGKMNESAQQGRTVLFVSHSMQTISSFCSRCVMLDGGQVVADGATAEVLLQYFGATGSGAGRIDFMRDGRVVGDAIAQLMFGDVVDEGGASTIEVDIRTEVRIRMGFRVLEGSSGSVTCYPNFHFTTPGGVYAFVTGPDTPSELSAGDYVAECVVPADFLNEGVYFVGLALSSQSPALKVHFFESSGVTFNVRDPMEGSVGRQGYGGVIPGVVRPRLPWRVSRG